MTKIVSFIRNFDRLAVTTTLAAGLVFASFSWAKPDGRTPERKLDLTSVTVLNLRPTQLAVGMAEVEKRVSRLGQFSVADFVKYEERKPVRVIKGPEGELYIVDGHHLTMVAWLLGIEVVKVEIVADWSRYAKKDFWKKMIAEQKVYLYDENGKGPLPVSSLPKDITGLKDDPYRSLSYEVREAGGYEKTATTPYSEFYWANFFRERVKMWHDKSSYKKAIAEALSWAESKKARELPGFMSKCARRLQPKAG